MAYELLLLLLATCSCRIREGVFPPCRATNGMAVCTGHSKLYIKVSLFDSIENEIGYFFFFFF